MTKSEPVVTAPPASPIAHFQQSSILQRKKRLLYVNCSLDTGGIETMIRDFALRLDSARFTSFVAVFEGDGALENELKRAGVTILNLKKSEGHDLGAAWRLRQAIRSNQIDIVHSHNYAAWFYCAMASFGMPSVRLVHTEHSRVSGPKRRRILERVSAMRTHSVVAVSSTVRDFLVHEVGLRSGSVSLIQNGIDTSRFSPDARKRAAKREALSLLPDAFVIGVVARLVPIKAHEVLLDGFALLLESLPNAVLVIVGEGPSRSRIVRRIEELGITKSVILTGSVSNPEEILNAMDIYALSSDDEGMNLTLLEAMSTGLPVVATAVGGNPEVVTDGETGWLVPPRDPRSLATKFLLLANNAAMRISMGQQGALRARDRFSQKGTLSAYERLYLDSSSMDDLDSRRA